MAEPRVTYAGPGPVRVLVMPQVLPSGQYIPAHWVEVEGFVVEMEDVVLHTGDALALNLTWSL